MIDFESVWLPQILNYAKLISTRQLEDEWLGRVARNTSITEPDELHEQVFDDLDADGIWRTNRKTLAPTAADAIDRFLSALRNIDEADAHVLVASDAWAQARKAASAVVANVR